ARASPALLVRPVLLRQADQPSASGTVPRADRPHARQFPGAPDGSGKEVPRRTVPVQRFTLLRSVGQEFPDGGHALLDGRTTRRAMVLPGPRGPVNGRRLLGCDPLSAVSAVGSVGDLAEVFQ